MGVRLLSTIAPIFVLFLITAVHAAAQGYPGYPYTIMAPEPGARGHHRAEGSRRVLHGRTARLPGAPVSHRSITIARGSSGSVLPTPLPRTPLILPEGRSMPTVQATRQQPGPTILPGTSPIPNLPHGPETFQDRASRCAFQQGLYNVPGDMNTQYMGACLQ
jgi:hypothetical protein